jgi:capsular polysaccharide transport system permease protein
MFVLQAKNSFLNFEPQSRASTRMLKLARGDEQSLYFATNPIHKAFVMGALFLPSKLHEILDLMKVQGRVIYAILMRDMRTRFGRTHLTYLVAIGWPLSHLAGMILAFTMVNRLLPFGTDSTVFITTGVLPYVLCLYPSRMMAIMMNHTGGALQFPIVHSIHLIVARSILEGLTAFAVVIVLVFVLWCADVEIMPNDVPGALLAIYAAVFFGLTIGTLTTVLRAIFKTAGYVVMVLTMVGLYLSSGVYVSLTPSSETMRTLIGLNPIYQLVTWMRSAYFETYPAVPLDKHYVVLLSLFLLSLGLLGERLFRGKFLT